MITRVFAVGGLTLDWVDTGDGPRGPNVGGNAAYAAVGAWLTGADAAICAVVGRDYPAGLLNRLSDAGIDLGVIREVSGPSFRVLLDESSGVRHVSYLPGSGVNRDLDPIPSQLTKAQAGVGVHLCAIPVSSQRMWIGALQGPRFITLDTIVIPNQIEPTQGDLASLAQEIDAFLPSEDEVRRLWNVEPAEGLPSLHALGFREVVIKMGAAGAIGMSARERLVMPPVREAVVTDSTGAGDTFCGAYCAMRTGGASLRGAMAWATAAASVVIENYGLLHALAPDRRQLTADRAAALLKAQAAEV